MVDMDSEVQRGGYLRFIAMIATAMTVMFLLTYLNSSEIIGHARFSETRLFMTLIMGGAMVLIMLAYMLHMYRDKKANIGLVIVAVLLFSGGLWLVRSQATVTDVDFMEGMIPHHSIAILTSDRARIEDPRVRKLADGIIEAQRREIKEMDWLIQDIRENGVATSQKDADQRSVPDFSAHP